MTLSVSGHKRGHDPLQANLAPRSPIFPAATVHLPAPRYRVAAATRYNLKIHLRGSSRFARARLYTKGF